MVDGHALHTHSDKESTEGRAAPETSVWQSEAVKEHGGSTISTVTDYFRTILFIPIPLSFTFSDTKYIGTLLRPPAKTPSRGGRKM